MPHRCVVAFAVTWTLSGCLSIDDSRGPSNDASLGGSDAGVDASAGAPADGGGSGGSAGATADSSVGAGVACGSSECVPPGEDCCQSLSGGGYTPKCQAPTEACTNGTFLSCDGPEDCAPGDVCCGTIVQDFPSPAMYGTVSCLIAVQCDENKNMRVFCGTDAGACPSGLSCKSSTILSGYNVCQP